MYNLSKRIHYPLNVSNARTIKSVIKEILESPNDDFIKFVIKERFKFKVTQQFIQASRPLVQKSIQETIAELISQKLNIEIDHNQPVLVGAPTPQPAEKNVYYTQTELDSLGTFEEFEGVTIVFPKAEAYKQLLRTTAATYSVEKGNPLSEFFISSVVMQGSTTYGYLVGQYVNQGEDVKLYTVKSNEIAKFLAENPVVQQTGFINARLSSRTHRGDETIYFLKSCLHNLSFKDVPNLTSSFEEAGKFFT